MPLRFVDAPVLVVAEAALIPAIDHGLPSDTQPQQQQHQASAREQEEQERGRAPHEEISARADAAAEVGGGGGGAFVYKKLRGGVLYEFSRLSVDAALTASPLLFATLPRPPPTAKSLQVGVFLHSCELAANVEVVPQLVRTDPALPPALFGGISYLVRACVQQSTRAFSSSSRLSPLAREQAYSAGRPLSAVERQGPQFTSDAPRTLLFTWEDLPSPALPIYLGLRLVRKQQPAPQPATPSAASARGRNHAADADARAGAASHESRSPPGDVDPRLAGRRVASAGVGGGEGGEGNRSFQVDSDPWFSPRPDGGRDAAAELVSARAGFNETDVDVSRGDRPRSTLAAVCSGFIGVYAFKCVSFECSCS
jgi:hypothetical protein